ncbi:glycosyltransferase family 2 protein [Treponema putidum]|uniref:Glycosyltransferase family 2 protein n=1 Tax=Treponema putidum TaxID=221027 RepID=A0ABY5HUS1_9SPIR|nr:glycosyltransferase family 2 protein [Treponema putidum]UTY28319.1 glycosyltransferase family 2 protein [Treponema putidum]
MKFSIIIPIYNTEKYLEKSILSVLDQSYTDYELICVNDGSTDNSTQILSTFADNPKIKLIHNNANKGPHCVRKIGVQNATGDYILFLDSDDWLEQNALKILAKELSNSRPDYIEFGYYMVSANGQKKIWRFSKADKTKKLTDILSSKANFTIWNKCYNANTIKSIYDALPDFYAVFAEDYYQIVILEYFIKTRKLITCPLYNYRVTTGISNIPYFDNLEKTKNIDISLNNISQNLSSFFEKENHVEYTQLIQCFINVRYLTILKNTHSYDVIRIVKERFGEDGFTLLLMQELKIMDEKTNKIDEKYAPLSVFAKILKKPFAYIKKIIKT